MPANYLLLTRVALLVCAWILSVDFHAQESVNSSGSEATSGTGTVSYSVGQVVYTTNSSGTISSAEGVQQPYEISEITSVTEPNSPFIGVSIYPNPTAEVLTINTSELTSDLRFYLYDAQGKIIKNGPINSKETTISMTNLAAANYLLKVTRDEQSSRVFQIQKH